MRLTIGVLLTALLTPLAHAELIDEVNDRNELRIAISADSSTNIRKQGQWTGFEIGLGQALATGCRPMRRNSASARPDAASTTRPHPTHR